MDRRIFTKLSHHEYSGEDEYFNFFWGGIEKLGDWYLLRKYVAKVIIICSRGLCTSIVVQKASKIT